MFRNNKFEIREEHLPIFRLTIFEAVEIELEDVMEMAAAFRKLSQGQKFAVLLDATKPFTLSSEARNMIASKELTSDRMAAAFVTRSLANKLVGNFFIKFNKPATPTRLFSDEAAAMVWLREMVKKNKSSSLEHLTNSNS
jgi:hypothetical protein